MEFLAAFVGFGIVGGLWGFLDAETEREENYLRSAQEACSVPANSAQRG